MFKRFLVASVVLSALISVPVLIPAEAATNDTRGAHFGVEIKWKPIIYVTMEPGTTNTLYWRDTLTDGEWEECFFLHDHVVGTNAQRMVFESSRFDETARTGFFKLEVDGVALTNIARSVSTNNITPPVPGA